MGLVAGLGVGHLYKFIRIGRGGKVTDYIYSRYCNWVAFLCTSTITFIKYILFEVLYFATF